MLHHAARKFLSQDSARWTDFAFFWKISKNDIEILTVILISVRKGNFCSSSIFFIECYTQTAASCEKWPLVGVFRNYSQFQAFGRLHLPLLFQGHRFFVNLFFTKISKLICKLQTKNFQKINIAPVVIPVSMPTPTYRLLDLINGLLIFFFLSEICACSLYFKIR